MPSTSAFSRRQAVRHSARRHEAVPLLRLVTGKRPSRRQPARQWSSSKFNDVLFLGHGILRLGRVNLIVVFLFGRVSGEGVEIGTGDDEGDSDRVGEGTGYGVRETVSSPIRTKAPNSGEV
jgi:hypothetical protein